MKYDILGGFKEFLESNLKKNTAKTYYSAVKNMFVDLDFNNLNEIDQKYIINKLQSMRTKNKVSAAKNGLKYLKKYDDTLNLPEESVFKEIVSHKRNHVKSKGKAVDFESMKRKVNTCKDNKMKLACRLAAVSGLRVSELADLESQDIEFMGNYKMLVRIRNGKGGKSGTVETLPDKYVYENLQKYIDTVTGKEKLFYGESYMRKYALDHGMQMHDFRRAFAIMKRRQCINDGLSSQDANQKVQEALRHDRFSNTKRYLYGRKINIKAPKRKKLNSKKEEQYLGSINVGEKKIFLKNIHPFEYYDLMSAVDVADLTDEEIDTIKVYTGRGYDRINKALYNSSKNVPEEIKQHIKVLTRCIARKSIARDEIVYRGVESPYVLFELDDVNTMTLEQLKKAYEGTLFINECFMSTSVDENQAKKFAGFNGLNMLLKITVPNGMKGIYLGLISHCPEEREVLIQKRSVLQIKEITQLGNTIMVNADLIYQIKKEV